MKFLKGEMDKGKSLNELPDADVFKDWNNWGPFFTMINKNSWKESGFRQTLTDVTVALN